MANSNRNAKGTYAQMQAVLTSQEAANEATRQAMQAIQVTMNGVLNSLDSILSPTSGGAGYNTSPAVGGNGRPTMNQHQTRQSYSTSSVNYPGPGNPNYGRGLGGLRNHAAKAINNAIGAPSGNSYEKITDAQGTHVGYKVTDKSGGVQYRPTWGVSDDELAAAGARSTTSGVLGALGEGGIINGLRAVPEVAGVVAGVEAVKQGMTVVGDERAKNAQYQSIYNGTNMAGMGQRADQFGYQLKNLFGGGLTWGQSQEAFQGVSALGVQGSQRSTDLDFVNKNYSSMGVSVSDSLKLITTATNDLNVSLTNLASGLKGTRDAAVSAGMSANVGTQIYQNTYSALAGTYSDPTGGVAKLSGVLGAAQASLGRYASGVDLSGMMSNPGQIARLANLAGTTSTDFLGNIQLGSSNVLGAISKSISGRSDNTSNPLLNAYIQNALKTAPRQKDGSIAPNVLDQIASQVNANSSSLGYIAQTQSGQYNALGLNTNAASATDIMVANAANQIISPSTLSNYGVVKPNLSSITKDVSKTASRGGKLNKTYDFGKANPVVGEAVSALKSGKYTQVQVIGSDGKPKTVSVDEAQKNYPDQLALGSAVVAGTGGTTIAQLLGGKRQATYNYEGTIVKDTGVTPGTVKSKMGRGETVTTAHNQAITKPSAPNLAAAAKAAAVTATGTNTPVTASGKGVAGTVTVEPGPALNGLLSFVGSGNVNIAYQNAASGTVPVPGQ